MEREVMIGISILVLSAFALGFVFYVNVFEPFEFLDDPLFGEGLGTLCDSDESCISFCSTNMGRCNRYCKENPSNEFCGIIARGI